MTTAPLRAAIAALLFVLAGCATVPTGNGFTPAQERVLTEQGFVRAGDGYALSIADRLLFAVDSSEVEASERATIIRIGAALIGVGITRARIEGHSDSTGTRAHNAALSLDRARMVAAVLADGGFAPADLALRGRGEDQPVASNATAEGRAENRRVVIIVTAPGAP